MTQEVTILPLGLAGTLSIPSGARALVIFAHGSGSSRFSTRNRAVAEALNRAGFATLLFDLLTEAEDQDRANRFDIPLLATRLEQASAWVRLQPDTKDLPIGYFGASTGAAAALVAASHRDDIYAVVSRGGRPDLADGALARVAAPVLLIVGGQDEEVLELNGRAQLWISGECSLRVVEGATHLFEEPGTMEQVSELACEWFTSHLQAHRGTHARHLHDRVDAGRRLARLLEKYKNEPDCLVMGLPRGGVVVAAEIARRLVLPMDACVVRKLGVPYQPEVAMGAVAGGHITVLHQDIIRSLHLDPGDIAAEIEAERNEVRRRESAYRHGRPFPDVHEKTVILADDGIATGATMEAAIQVMRQQKAKRVVVAVGVAPKETVRRLARSADEVVAALEPEDLRAISLWFDDFAQVEDAEVLRLMEAADTARV